MAEFTPITTQEEFDKAIGARLGEEREKIAKKYADYDQIKKEKAELEKQLAELNKSLEKTSEKDKTIAELTEKITSYELTSLKTRIAYEVGIPYELANRLSGNDEKSIRADAESLAKLVQNKQQLPPLKSTEPAAGDSGKQALKSLLTDLRGGK